MHRGQSNLVCDGGGGDGGAADGGGGGGAAGAGVSRLFGYVLGGPAPPAAPGVMPAAAFARLGYEGTLVGSFAEEEVEWPRAEEGDEDSD